jgi:FG-GAP-like repeat
MSSNLRNVESLESRRLLSFAVVDDALDAGSATLAADFDNDHVPDLACSRGQAVDIRLGRGDGTFGAAQTYPTGVPPYGRTASFAAADFNGDGNVDLVAANFYDNAVGFPTLLLGNGDGTLQAAQGLGLHIPPAPGGEPILYSLSTLDVAAADANGDGLPDALFTGEIWFNDFAGEGPYAYGYTAACLGRGDGTFSSAFGVTGAQWILGPVEDVDFVAADLNADGNVDMVSANGARFGQGDGTFSAWRAFSGAHGDRVAVADFTGDGKLDVAALNLTGNGGIVRPGNGDGTVRAALSFVSGASPRSVGTADFNGDGRADLVTANGERSLTVCLGNGNGTFKSPLSFPVAPADAGIPSDVNVADLNGDGRADITVGDYVFGSGGGIAGGYSNLRVLLNDGNWATRTFVGAGGAGAGGSWSTAANWSPSGVPAASDLVTISGKSVNLSASATAASITLTGGASLSVASNGSRVLRSNTLFISGNSNLNLNDNDLILDYSGVTPLTDVVSKIIQGRGASPAGIYSAPAKASPYLNALGVAEASQVLGITGTQTRLFAGQAVDATAVLVKFTYAGDANLDGKINVDDYGRIDFNASSGKSGWFNGDFNYDGKINVDDYGIIDFNVGIQGPPLSGAAVAAGDVAMNLPTTRFALPMRKDEKVAESASLVADFLG